MKKSNLKITCIIFLLETENHLFYVNRCINQISKIYMQYEIKEHKYHPKSDNALFKQKSHQTLLPSIYPKLYIMIGYPITFSQKGYKGNKYLFTLRNILWKAICIHFFHRFGTVDMISLILKTENEDTKAEKLTWSDSRLWIIYSFVWKLLNIFRLDILKFRYKAYHDIPY